MQINKIDFKNSKLVVPFIVIVYIIISIIGWKLLIAIGIGIFIYFLSKKVKKNGGAYVFQNDQNVNNNFNTNYMSETIRSAVINEGTGKLVKFGILGVIVVVLLFMSVTVIGAGETGVVSLFGKVNDNEIKSGIHLINPLASVNNMSVRTEEYTMSKASTEGKKTGDDSITALTKEGLTVSMDVTTFYHLEESKASDLYREVGLTYEEKIIRPEIRSAIREMVAQYEAKDIYSEKRSEAAKNILAYLNNKVRERGIVIEDLLIRDVTLPANLSQAIQEKLKAEQESQRYDFVLDKEKKEAERKVIEAQGQRDAQKIIDESLSAKYLDYLYINGLKDRQGTIYVPMNASTGMPMFKGIE
jgi:regulator of protease activity HflC (stomatin/prohibitin superfamily)